MSSKSSYLSSNQTFAASDPKWRTGDNGVLIHTNGKDQIQRGEKNRWQSVSKHTVKKGESTPPRTILLNDLVVLEH